MEARAGAEYRLRWQVPLCSLVFLIPTAVAVAVLHRPTEVHLRASDPWLPCWRRVLPRWLLGYRAAVFVVTSCVLYRDVVGHGASAFYFYTRRYNRHEGMKGYLDSPGRKVPSRKCCSCRRGFGTRRVDAARKRGPLAEHAIRYPEAALGSCWYLNAGTGFGTLKAALEKTWHHAEGPHLSTELGWAMMGLAHEGD
ncbi:hypothetical protein Taro_043877 [Colocasia esculenta]|uniref:Uncharacterized protein n=1 Tax=Colocasia esculenta TaxID=4460 RepID=A0A843WSH4_COLES|nr:hypothetical protein [Colocasia esculenta]